MNLNHHSQAQTSTIQQPTSGKELQEVQDRYAESILSYCTHMYDAIEVHGVRDQLAGTGTDETCFEVDNDNPQLFSVYVRLITGGVDAVGDFSKYEWAAAYSRELAARYQWPVHDHVPDKHRGLATLQ